jgi:hypothetical protein
MKRYLQSFEQFVNQGTSEEMLKTVSFPTDSVGYIEFTGTAGATNQRVRFYGGTDGSNLLFDTESELDGLGSYWWLKVEFNTLRILVHFQLINGIMNVPDDYSKTVVWNIPPTSEVPGTFTFGLTVEADAEFFSLDRVVGIIEDNPFLNSQF